MQEETKQLHAVLKKHHLSMTLPRVLVFTTLSDLAPMSMSQLVKMLHQEIDRASVYRTVRLFESLGIVQRIHIGWKYNLELSDAFQPHHHHLTCIQCGIIIPLQEHERLEKIITELAQAENFTLTKHQLELQGLCKQCSRAKYQHKT